MSGILPAGNGASSRSPAPSTGRRPMATLLLLTNAMQPSAEVLPALGLLSHSVRVAPLEISAMLDSAPTDALLVDARRDLIAARSLTRLLQTTGISVPVFA